MRKGAPPDDALLSHVKQKIKDLNESAGWKHHVCELATPMYGGGVQKNAIDKAMPVRASAIRGQLRFWWRIACGPFASPEEMFRRETEIWGGIGRDKPTASLVKVRVQCPPARDKDLLLSSSESHPAIKYAFGPAAINGPVNWLQAGYEFRLSLRYPDSIKSDVERALQWWASFGGIGARTRRGFGAVHIKTPGIVPISSAEVEEVKGRLLITGKPGNKAEIEWKTAIDRLYSFRQKGGIGRTASTPRPGRSFWPEADQLRHFTGKDGNGKHKPIHTAGNMFPRAAFGLPITFEFKGTPGEPPTHELHPQDGSDRMASPLILRPYWNGSAWQAAALLLPGWEKALVQPLKFKAQSYVPQHWPADPNARRDLAKKIKPMAGRGDDPLTAFMNFFKEGK
jgi:CRISPR-associated protein Cmr1